MLMQTRQLTLSANFKPFAQIEAERKAALSAKVNAAIARIEAAHRRPAYEAPALKLSGKQAAIAKGQVFKPLNNVPNFGMFRFSEAKAKPASQPAQPSKLEKTEKRVATLHKEGKTFFHSGESSQNKSDMLRYLASIGYTHFNVGEDNQPTSKVAIIPAKYRKA